MVLSFSLRYISDIFHYMVHHVNLIFVKNLMGCLLNKEHA